MNRDEILQYFKNFTENESFYKEYFYAKQNPETLERFIRSYQVRTPQNAEQWLPDLHMSGSDWITESFIKEPALNLSVSKHERYTPLFLHSHDFFEMVYLLQGCCVNTIEGKAIVMQEEDICIIAPEVNHTIEIFDDDSILLNFIIRKSTFRETFYEVFTENTALSLFFTKILNKKNSDSYILFHTAENRELCTILDVLISESINVDSPYRARLMDNLLRSAFCILLRNHSFELSVGTMHKASRIYEILQYIQNNYQNISLSRLAEKFNYSSNYMGNLIKKETGITFLEIVQDIRMRKAGDLLKNTAIQVTEIASLVGYDSLEFFHRAFKKRYHITPGQYRKLQKHND